MAVIVPGKFAFFFLPRTASISTEHMLMGIGTRLGGITKGAYNLPNHHIMPQEVGLDFPIPTVTTIRHPREILRSWKSRYAYSSLEEMLERNPSELLIRENKLLWNRPENFDIVLRFENIEVELQYLLSFFDLPPREFTHQNKTPREKIEFTEREEKYIENHFGEEMYRWGYI